MVEGAWPRGEQWSGFVQQVSLGSWNVHGLETQWHDADVRRCCVPAAWVHFWLCVHVSLLGVRGVERVRERGVVR